MKKCLTKDFKKRPTIKEIAEHEWLKLMVDELKVDEQEHVQVGLSMYNFKKASTFQSSIVAFMSGLLQKNDEIQRLSKIFTKLNTSKDGYITIDEIENSM